jgi:hypothetical protein
MNRNSYHAIEKIFREGILQIHYAYDIMPIGKKIEVSIGHKE